MASTKILETKNEKVNEIIENVKNSKSLVIIKFQGVSVEELSKLRRKLKGISGDVKVYKNTLVKRALDSLGYDLGTELEGPNAFVFGSDILDPIKAVAEFAKINKTVEMTSGIIDAKVVDSNVLKEYASIPSYEGLLSMFAGGLMEHVRNLAIGLDLYSTKLDDNR